MRKLIKHIFLYLFGKKYRKMYELLLRMQNVYFPSVLPECDLPCITLVNNSTKSVIYNLTFDDGNLFDIKLSIDNNNLKIEILGRMISVELVDRVYLIKNILIDKSNEVLQYFV